MRNHHVVFFALMIMITSFTGCVEDEPSIDNLIEDTNEMNTTNVELQELLANKNSTIDSLNQQITDAETNVSVHENQIAMLETQLDLAESQAVMLTELMSNMSDETNESFQQMTQMSEYISNLTAILNESYARHQENASLVSQLTVERDSLTIALEQANMTIADLQESALKASALKALQDEYAWGIMGATVLDPFLNGNPRVVMSGSSAETTFVYNSSIQAEHWIIIEFCSHSIRHHYSGSALIWLSNVSSGEYYGESDEVGWYGYDTTIRAVWNGGTFTPYQCSMLFKQVNANQYNDTWEFPNLGLMTDVHSMFEMQISVCLNQWSCTGSWSKIIDDESPEYAPSSSDHPLYNSNFIPVTVSGNPCAWDWDSTGRNSCEVPDECTERSNWQQIEIEFDCKSVFLHNKDPYVENTVTLLNASTALIYQEGVYNTQDVFVCVADAEIFVKYTYESKVNLYVRGLGESNELSETSAYTYGIVEGDSGSVIRYYNEYYGELNIRDWDDPNGIC